MNSGLLKGDMKERWEGWQNSIKEGFSTTTVNTVEKLMKIALDRKSNEIWSTDKVLVVPCSKCSEYYKRSALIWILKILPHLIYVCHCIHRKMWVVMNTGQLFRDCFILSENNIENPPLFLRYVNKEIRTTTAGLGNQHWQ